MMQKLFKIKPSKITVVPNGVDSQLFSPRNEDRQTIRLKYGLGDKPVVLFSGRLSWYPNIDALKIIFNDIYPALKRLIPEVVFMVVGTNPPHWLVSRQNKDVLVTQTQHQNVAAYVNAADVCIAPIRLGSGMCLKTLEYMSCGKPLISTSSGARGLDVIDRTHIIIQNNIPSFAGQIAYLLENRSLAMRLGTEARNLVQNTYDWKIIAEKSIKAYERLLAS
jgi:glycosyltransferase involved in cell wall biosynthesis